jgi:hypothetical protein
VTKAERPVEVKPFAVGPAMCQRVAHHHDNAPVNSGLNVPIENTDNTTHAGVSRA